MDFRGRVESFEEADRRYKELSRRREDKDITAEEFDAEARQLMVRDGGGRWWAKLGDLGEWHYRDGGDWVRGAPPGYQNGALHRQNTEIMAATPSPSGGKKRRRFPLWIPVAAILGFLLLLAVVATSLLVPLLQSGDETGGEGEGMGVGGQAGGSGGGEGAALEEIFVHRATSENISENSTFIDNSLTNDNPDAVLIVTQNWNPGGEGGTYNDHPVGVWYNADRGQWAVFNQDVEPMTEDAAFNVAVR